MQRRYVASYIPWAGEMGRRGIPTAGLNRVTWLQLVIDVEMDGHGPGELDAWYRWRRSTARDMLREAAGGSGIIFGETRPARPNLLASWTTST